MDIPSGVKVLSISRFTLLETQKASLLSIPDASMLERAVKIALLNIKSGSNAGPTLAGHSSGETREQVSGRQQLHRRATRNNPISNTAQPVFVKFVIAQ